MLNSKIVPTGQQKTVLKQILHFLGSKERIFILKGYAGTGKTTLMRFLINNLSDKNYSCKTNTGIETFDSNYNNTSKKWFCLIAPTGRAAKILSNLCGSSASTIHSMIYSFTGLNKDLSDISEENIKTNKIGQLYLDFEPRKAADNAPETIYIIDEASMVSDNENKDITQAKFGSGKLLTELLNYDTNPKSKYIFVGDPCQLPPVKESISPALDPDYFRNILGLNCDMGELTEIKRQDSNNSLVAVSKKIREMRNNAPDNESFYGSQEKWTSFPFSNHADILYHSTLEAMMQNYISNIKTHGYQHSTFICSSNRKCSELSNKIRKMLGLSGRLKVGDLLLVTQNNLITGLMNGDMVEVTKVSNHSTYLAGLTFTNIEVKDLFSDTIYSAPVIEEILYSGASNLNSDQQTQLFQNFAIRMKSIGITQQNQADEFNQQMYKDPFLNALRCVFGYSLTCHKAQGGEWDEVYVDFGAMALNPTKEKYQWVYTAITRAKSKLHVLCKPYNFG